MRPLVLALCLFVLFGCEQNPAHNQPKAQVATPDRALSAQPPVAGRVYSFSEANSSVAFVGAKLTGKHDGHFTKFSGQIRLDGDDPTKGSVQVEIDATSLTTDAEKLTGHLKSPDFFDVAHYPKVRFVSTRVGIATAPKASHSVTGELELHGNKKQLTFPAMITVNGNQVTVNAEFSINRKDFGIVYPGMPDDLIRDDVLVRLQVQASPSG